MSWFNSIMDTGTKVFSWMEENPTATSFIGGAAIGVLGYMESEEAKKEAEKSRKFERDMIAEERQYRDQFGGASTTEAGFSPPVLSDTEGGSLTGGPLTEGSLVKMSDAF